jgi:sensor histidine kinase YesM
MKRFRTMSIRKKILLTMLAFTLIPVTLVTLLATRVTYKTMRDQLIYDRRMSSGWLENRLSIELSETLDQFYQFEVDKELKSAIQNWFILDDSLDYESRRKLLTAMNTILSMDSRINEVSLFNLQKDQVLVAERSAAYMATTDDRLDLWQKRDPDLQTNLVYLRHDSEIVIYHQIYRFHDRLPMALVAIHRRPYHVQKILSDIKTVPEETILLLNDQHELLEADYGKDWSFDEVYVEEMRRNLQESDQNECSASDHFWFYRQVNNGKIQILFSVPNKTIIAALRPTILNSLFFAFMAVIASIASAIVFSNTVTRPIRDLSEQMTSLKLYEHKEIHHPRVRNDEIGVLQTSFDHMIARNKELIKQTFKSAVEKRDAQLRALQAQINPHFMYNTLQVIGGMALKKDAPEVYQITLALSDILRYSLNFSKEMVTLKEEIHYLESYVMIQNKRFNDRIELKLNLHPDTLHFKIPKLILQPLAENSFEHGLSEKLGAWILTIESLRGDRDELIITVKDNGTGFSEKRLQDIQSMLRKSADDALHKDSQIGLINVDARIRLCSPGEGYGVFIESSESQGTLVRVVLKAESEGDPE